jgi:hypothetical protein
MVRNYLIIFFLLISSKIFAQSDTMRVGKQRCFKNPKLNGYLGTQVTNFSFNNPSFYGTLVLQFTKFSIGGQYFVQLNNPSGYGFILECKLF